MPSESSTSDSENSNNTRGKPPYPQKTPYSGMQYHDFDVVEAARRRIRYLMNHFDDIVVSFSGGKDSLVCLELVDQEYKRAGRTDKVQAKFLDEELICDSIVNFMYDVYNEGRFDLKWYALPMYVGFFVLGQHKQFLSWDPKRKWHRQPPPWAIMDVGHDTGVHNENSIGQVLYPDTSRRVCTITGLRAQESQKRFQSISKGGRVIGGPPNYLAIEKGLDHVWMAKPIFDWTELDIFKFFKDHNIRYCACYDSQMWMKAPLRVASALHERAEAQFFKLKELEPLFYEQLRTFYPEVEAHFRYWKSVDRFSVMYSYPHTFDGIRQYIRERLDPSHHEEALRHVDGAETRRKNILKKDPTAPLGHMPVLQVFRQVVGGRFVKGTNMRTKITPEDIEYERTEPSPLPLERSGAD